MRIFKTKWFARFARKNGIGDRRLSDAALEIQGGLHDGDLGGNLVKKRVAREGQGKRGGYRTIAVHRAGERTIFVYGFPKSAKAGLNPLERDAYKNWRRST